MDTAISTLSLQSKELRKMKDQNFSASILVDKSPNEAYNAINNVRGWWSEEVEGSTNKVNDVFKYHFEDIHRSEIKVLEMVPGRKVVWLVQENYFKPGIFADTPKMTSEKAEWVGTKIAFDISEKDGKTLVKFTHLGLVPEYECFDACSNGWSHYIQQSLFNLINTGKGEPNGSGKPMTTDEKKLHSAAKGQDFTLALLVDQSPDEAFAAIQNVRGWWSGLYSEEFEGTADKINDEFVFRAGDGAHTTTQRLIELIPGKKIVWLVTDSK